jgi:hypothetical protein
VSSDERLKQDFAEIDPGLILKLHPYEYRLKADPAKRRYGLKAHDVKRVLDDMGAADADLTPMKT